MRKLTYLAVFETDGGSGMSVYFPDVPGCVSCGDNFDHALRMAKEALALGHGKRWGVSARAY
ncbi:hypothetical protein AGMMS50293_12470 [Spirochaetia bacterium]|nr:hypothetical protein AGMMS50293_08240 [Spirochaetia bacterium]GHV94927.1 hypothetical protein AGMMS50293_12470 [Spirochaetia bacterium]